MCVINSKGYLVSGLSCKSSVKYRRIFFIFTQFVVGLDSGSIDFYITNEQESKCKRYILGQDQEVVSRGYKATKRDCLSSGFLRHADYHDKSARIPSVPQDWYCNIHDQGAVLPVSLCNEV